MLTWVIVTCVITLTTVSRDFQKLLGTSRVFWEVNRFVDFQDICCSPLPRFFVLQLFLLALKLLKSDFKICVLEVCVCRNCVKICVP